MKNYYKHIALLILVITLGSITLISFNTYRLAQSVSSLIEPDQSQQYESNNSYQTDDNLSSLSTMQIQAKNEIMPARGGALATISTEKYLIYEQGNGKYETIDETVNRLKHDVVVTGTVVAFPGKESALFRIEGMPDREFVINTQLMDGFIIKNVTQDKVVLKNQQGEELIELKVGS